MFSFSLAIAGKDIYLRCKITKSDGEAKRYFTERRKSIKK